MAFTILDYEYQIVDDPWADCTVEMDNGDGTATITVGNRVVPQNGLKVRVKASGSRPAGAILYNSASFNIAQNITPVAPTIAYDDEADTLSASHALGSAEIVVSVNDGPFTAYSGQIIVGDVIWPQGYWKFKIKSAAGRNESAVVASPAFTAKSNPLAPLVTGDDSLNKLSASHTLGDSEIVVSENNGAFQPYSGEILVGNVARANGYWKFKVKAAPGRNESPVAESPEFTVSAVDATQYSDAGADVYLTAANIQDNTAYTEKSILGKRIKNASRRFFYKSKEQVLFNKIKGLWLFNGATSAANMLNAINPGVKDLSVAFGSNPTFSSKGLFIPAGTKLNSNFKLSDLNGVTLGMYKIDIGSDAGDYSAGWYDGNNGFGLGLANYLVKGGNINGTSDGLATVEGLTTLNISPDNTYYSIFVKGVKKKQGVPGNANTPMDIYFGGLNFSSNQATFQRSGYWSMLFMADFLTDAENAIIKTLVEEYCLDMMRGIERRFYFCGDSIVYGANSQFQSTRYTSQIAGNLLLTEINRGASGTKTSDWVNVSGLAQIPAYAVGDIGLLFALNTNDAAQGVPTATVKANMITILSNAKSKGWPVEKIVVNLGYHDTVVSQAVKDTYIQATLEACQDQGIPAGNCVNMKSYMLANGGDALIDPDKFHPTQSGHNVIAQGYIPLIESMIV